MRASRVGETGKEKREIAILRFSPPTMLPLASSRAQHPSLVDLDQRSHAERRFDYGGCNIALESSSD